MTGAGTKYYGSSISIDATVSAGYTWSAWTYTSGGAVFSNTKAYSSTMPANAISLTATATKNQYTISYTDPIGATNANRTSYTVTDSFTINPLSKAGYSFDGGTGSNGSVPQQSVSVAAGSTGNLSYTANWTVHTNTPYTVRHYVMTTDGVYDSTPTMTENLTGETDTTLTISTLKKTSAAYNVAGGIAFAYATQNGSQTHIESTTVAGDGSRVINIFFERFSYDVVLTKGTGISSVNGAGE